MKKPLQLQDKELQYLQDTHFLSTKLRIMKSLQSLLEQTQQALHQQKERLPLPAQVWEVPPKISRGENYRSLPYLVLDYPRIFQQETTFAYRTMLWWGHGFSCTLHLGGSYWQHYQSLLLAKLATLETTNLWVCVNNTPWEYHYEPDNYLPLEKYLQQPGALEKLASMPFFKVSRRIPLEYYQELPRLSTQTLEAFSALLQ
jgi:hypothetical protein